MLVYQRVLSTARKTDAVGRTSRPPWVAAAQNAPLLLGEAPSDNVMKVKAILW